jgi:membrane protein DedA with SNARE-associated domain
LEGFSQDVLAFVRDHAEWAGVVVFVTCFGESLAFVSLLLPGTTILFAMGTLLATGALDIWSLMAYAIVGAVLGDLVSYWIGVKLGPAAHRTWPFRTRPLLLERGIAFFEKHGGKSVFFGRFIGPMRAVVPLAAGILRMPARFFLMATVASAFVWAPAILLSGDLVGQAAADAVEGKPVLPLALLAFLVLGGLFMWVLRWWSQVRADVKR